MPGRRNKVNKKQDSRPRQRSASRENTSQTQERKAVNPEHENMLQWLKTVRFRKAFFGGVSEQDVWKRLEELNDLYEKALIAERVRYDTMLNEYSKTAKTQISNYQRANRVLQKENEELRQSVQDVASSN